MLWRGRSNAENLALQRRTQERIEELERENHRVTAESWRKDAELQSLRGQLEGAKQDLEKLRRLSKLSQVLQRMPDFVVLETNNIDEEAERTSHE